MKLKEYKIKILIFIVLLLSLSFYTQSNAVEKTEEHYKFDTWPKSDKQPIVGFKMDDYKIDGFTLKRKKIHPPTGGIDYIWFDETSNTNVHVIINLYQTSEKAREEFINWLLVGVNVPLKKGTLLSSTETIGDISWCDIKSSLLTFQRDNVFIIIHGQPLKTQNHPMIVKTARNIDDILVKKYRPVEGVKTIKKIQPIIKQINLRNARLKLNESVLITVETKDPRGESVEYYVRASGGNIVKTKDGYMYHALKTGKQTITIFAINESNVKTEKSIDIVVTDK